MGIERRLVMDGEEYTIDEGDVILDSPEMRKAPDVNVQGEPWGWTKEGPKPKGYREDGIYE